MVIVSFKNDILHHGINKYLWYSLSALFGRNKEKRVHNFISGCLRGIVLLSVRLLSNKLQVRSKCKNKNVTLEETTECVTDIPTCPFPSCGKTAVYLSVPTVLFCVTLQAHTCSLQSLTIALRGRTRVIELNLGPKSQNLIRSYLYH